MQWHEVAVILIGIVVALIGIVYRNDEKTRANDKLALEAKITALEAKNLALEKQNLDQETRLATITANATNHGDAMDRLSSTIARLDEKVDEFTKVLGQIVTMLPRGGYAPRMTPPTGTGRPGG